MIYRVTDATTNARLTSQLGRQRQQVAQAQEQVSTGKRINRPSDDPASLLAVLRLRTHQSTLEQFKRNSQAAEAVLSAGDAALDTYQQSLDRVQSLLTQGLSDTTTAAGKQAISQEVEGLRNQLLALANRQSADGRFLFGGTRQDSPPFDETTGAPASSPAFRPLLQLEPATAPIPIGVTAEEVFSNSGGSLFSTLAQAVTALRGTGQPATDKLTLTNSLAELETFVQQAAIARTTLGKSLNAKDQARERLDQDFLTADESIQNLEGVDLATASVQLLSAQSALEATLQSSAHLGRRSLLDILA